MFTISDKPAATTAPTPLPAGSSLPTDGAFAAALDMLCPQEALQESSPQSTPANGAAAPETPFRMAALPMLPGATASPEAPVCEALPANTPLSPTPPSERDEKKDETSGTDPAAQPAPAIPVLPLPQPPVVVLASESSPVQDTGTNVAASAPAVSRETQHAAGGEENIPGALSTVRAAAPTVLPVEARPQVSTPAVTPDGVTSRAARLQNAAAPSTSTQATVSTAAAQTPPDSHLRLILTDPRIEEPLAAEIQPPVTPEIQNFPRRITLRPAGELRLDISLDAPAFGDNAAITPGETPLPADTTATRIATRSQATTATADTMPEPVTEKAGNKNGTPPQLSVIQGSGEIPGLLRATSTGDTTGATGSSPIRQSGPDESGIVSVNAAHPSGERSSTHDFQEESTPQQAPFALPQHTTAVSSATATAPTHAVHYTSASDEDAVAQIIRAARVQLDSKHGGTMEMRLDPPALGHVRLQVTYQDGSLTAFLGTETPAAQQLLEQQSGALRTALQESGLPVASLHVGLDFNYAQSGNQQPQQEAAQAFPQRDVSGETPSASVPAPVAPARWSSTGLDFLA